MDGYDDGQNNVETQSASLFFRKLTVGVERLFGRGADLHAHTFCSFRSRMQMEA
jgi:hypothetical protein